MRKLLLFAFWALQLASYAQDVDVLHYRYQIEVNDRSDSIYAKAQIKLVLKEKTAALSFDLQNIGVSGKGMIVSDIDMNESDGLLQDNSVLHGKKDLFFLHENNQVVVRAVKYKKGDTAIVRITYKGIPADGLIISKNKYGERTFFADNWPYRAHHWLPCIDRPDDKASFEFLVTAPLHYSVISNGTKVEEKDLGHGNRRTHWKETEPQPTKVMVIGVAKFATKTYEDSPKDIPISAWVYPQDSAKGFYDYALTPSIVKFFSEYIGPFPYKKLANVQSKTIFGGMENASAIFYAENSVTGDRSEEDLMVHEIAHQWFGDAASEKSFAHLWLSEGFASYFTNFYFEKKYGKDAAAKRWQEDREKVIDFAKTSAKPVVDTSTNLMSLLNANSYQKGAWVLYMLRQEVGDSTFLKIVQGYYHQYKRSNADSRDFEAVAEKISGKELTWFFDQWLYRPGVPKLETKVITKNGEQVLSIRQQQSIPFEFNLEIAVASRFNKTLQIRTIRIKNRETLVAIPTGGNASLDPGSKLLYDGPAAPFTHEKSR